jgi:uncharacterized damage-inducible protein DinB
MKADEIRLCFEYNYWANRRILAACEGAGEERYAASTGPGSLRATLVHVVDSEWGWRTICGRGFVAAGASPRGAAPENPWDLRELTEADLPTLDALKDRWQTEEREMRAYLAGLTDEALNGSVRYRIDSGTVRDRLLWHCLLHVVNHGTQHRAEAAALLTGMGYSPGDVDLTVFLNEHLHLPS